MNKHILILLLFFSTTLFSQEEKSLGQTSAMRWYISSNTINDFLGKSGVSIKKTGDDYTTSAGVELGFYVVDNLALQFGFTSFPVRQQDENVQSYKVGLKYSIKGKTPIGLNYIYVDQYKPITLDRSRKDFHYIALSLGRNLFIGNNVILEPLIQYNKEIKDKDDNFLVSCNFKFTIGNNSDTIDKNQTNRGKWLLETNFAQSYNEGNTGFASFTEDNENTWLFGFDAGYFIVKNLAIKFGVSGKFNFAKEFNFNTGLKYYLGNFPLSIEYNMLKPSRGNNQEVINYEVGYAFFLNSNFSIQPTLQYKRPISKYLDEEFNFLIGLACHF